MLAKIYAPALYSLEGRLIEIECDLAGGLPGFVVVGLADKAVGEARERVRSAIKNSGLMLPQRRLTLNLAPADLPKDGTGYDLGMAVAVLVASGQLEASLTDKAMFMGELALDGSLRPVKGAILAAQLASHHGCRRMYVPPENAAEAALSDEIEVIAVPTLQDLYRHLLGETPLDVVKNTAKALTGIVESTVDMSMIYGQAQAKRSLEIAAAGGHNILLSGPPGAGKTLLSKALAGILPPLTLDEMLEVTKIHSLAGVGGGGIVRQRPFRAPHHTASSVALIGGGAIPRPGEISLSHHGVLFLDELPEFPRSVLEVLRQPLEDRRVTVARASRSVTFPANFMLVGTSNPCPCGYLGDTRQACSCTPYHIKHYQHRLSGPLLDRIDLVVEVARPDNEALIGHAKAEPTAEVAKRVAAARKVQSKRFKKHDFSLNSQMDNAAVKRFCRLDPETKVLARQAMMSLGLSARAYNRVIKVARTIADLDSDVEITTSHFAEALQYRAREMNP